MMPLIFINSEKEEIFNYLKKNIKKDYIIFEVFPKEKKFSIDDIKSIIKETSVYYEKIRVYLFLNFHLSSIEAQNAFLKILEEPPSNVLFILTCDNQYKLLPTILSRSIILNFLKQKIQITKKKEEIINNFLKSNILDLNISQQISIDDLIIFLKKNIISLNNKEYFSILKKSLEIKNLIEKNNLNPQLSLEYLLISIKKLNKK
ncbi:MAG: hypothetical protein N2593_03105 [Patescibacteria group bacterium]|nr:hypothetical protein [Patescibacteria group bacterium]